MNKLLAIVLVMLATLPAWGQSDYNTILPADTALRHGVLPNGFSYYVLSQPEVGAVNLKLVTKVGSVCETPAESGLAHFLEHMTFEGTTRFPGDSASRMLRSFGLEMGTDFNATTGFDETEFDIKNLTKGIDAHALRKSMLVLRDWASALTLADSSISKQRRIVEEEWRTGHDYTERMLDTMLTTLMPGSPYAGHLPIGNIDNVRSFRPEVLRQFYNKWYRPDLQAIFVAGDIDADATVGMIKELFSPLHNPAGAPERKPSIVPDHKGQRVVVYADDEATSTNVIVSFLHDKPGSTYRNTKGYYRDMMMRNMATTLLNMRFNDMVRTRHTGLLNGGSTYDDYLVCNTKEAFTLVGLAEPKRAIGAMQSLVNEARRAQLHGFSQTEFDRGIQFWQAQIASNKQSVSELTRSDLISSYVGNFETGDDLYSPAETLDLMAEMLGNLTLEQVNGYMSGIIGPDNVNISISGPHIAGYAYPNAEQVAQQFLNSINSAPEALSDTTVSRPLMTKLPKSGNIVKQTNDDNITLLKLSNGAVVLLRPTDCKTDEIVFKAFSYGGYNACGTEHSIAARAMSAVIEASGLGGLSYIETEKAILNKDVNLSFNINHNTEGFAGKSGKKDLPTLMQLLYLYFTEVTKDTASFNATIVNMKSGLLQANNNPDEIFNDSTTSTLRGDYIFSKPLSAADVDKIDYDEVLQLYRQRVANPADFIFTLVGSFNLDTAITLVKQYIAAIPKGNGIESVGGPIPFRNGEYENRFSLPMSTVKSKVDCIFAGHMPLTTNNMASMELLQSALDVMLNEHMREASKGTYGVDVSCGITEAGEQWSVRYQFDTNNAQREQLIAEADSIVNQVLTSGISAELFDKIHNLQLTNYYFAIADNDYWTFDLYMLGQHGIDYNEEYHDFIVSSNLSDFNKFVTSLKQDSHLLTVMQGVAKR